MAREQDWREWRARRNRPMMEIEEYPLLHYPDLILALLRSAEQGEAGLFDAIAWLRRSVERVHEKMPDDLAELVERLGTARDHLIAANLLAMTGEGRFQITPRGRVMLSAHPGAIDDTTLMEFPEFQDFVKSQGRSVAEDPQPREYDEGYLAYQDGLRHSDNPYRPDTSGHQVWENGWFEARDEAKAWHRLQVR